MFCTNCGMKNVENAKFCTSCGKTLNIGNNEESLSEESVNSSVNTKIVSFWRHALNWKYYIAPFIIGIIIAYDFSQTGEKVFSKVMVINFIIGLIAYYQFKAKFWKSFGMFIIAGLISGLIMAATYLGAVYIFEKIDGDGGKRQKAITVMLNMNSKLPMMINDELQLIEYSSPNNKTITMHGKFINYTKDDVLTDYSNVSQFETEMLKQELETSCPVESTKKMFAMGLEMNIEYLGKDNNIIGKINLNDEKCKPYYK